VRAAALAPILILLTCVSAAAAPSAPSFQVTASTPSSPAPREPDSPELGVDRDSVDIDALEKYDDAVKFERGDEDPADKAEMWRSLGSDVPRFADMAETRAEAWESFAQRRAAAEAARAARIAARDADWARLAPLLAAAAAKKADKRAWTEQFVAAYLADPGLEPAAAKALLPFAAPGASKETLKKLAQKAPREAKPTAGAGAR
jgi:hypothetical protein